MLAITTDAPGPLWMVTAAGLLGGVVLTAIGWLKAQTRFGVTALLAGLGYALVPVAVLGCFLAAPADGEWGRVIGLFLGIQVGAGMLAASELMAAAAFLQEAPGTRRGRVAGGAQLVAGVALAGVVAFFDDGGPIMVALLAVALIALTVGHGAASRAAADTA